MGASGSETTMRPNPTARATRVWRRPWRRWPAPTSCCSLSARRPVACYQGRGATRRSVTLPHLSIRLKGGRAKLLQSPCSDRRPINFENTAVTGRPPTLPTPPADTPWRRRRTARTRATTASTSTSAPSRSAPCAREPHSVGPEFASRPRSLSESPNERPEAGPKFWPAL
jgi:hypothetical protein